MSRVIVMIFKNSTERNGTDMPSDELLKLQIFEINDSRKRTFYESWTGNYVFLITLSDWRFHWKIVTNLSKGCDATSLRRNVLKGLICCAWSVQRYFSTHTHTHTRTRAHTHTHTHTRTHAHTHTHTKEREYITEYKLDFEFLLRYLKGLGAFLSRKLSRSPLFEISYELPHTSSNFFYASYSLQICVLPASFRACNCKLHNSLSLVKRIV